MKPGTTAKLKFLELKTALALPKWQAVGLLESLWEFVAENCPDGDIGRYSPAQIALVLEYTGEPKALIDALIDTRWLDRDSEGMVWIHNWGVHCPKFVTERAELRYLRYIPIPCASCGAEFHPTHTRSKYCTPACRVTHYRQKHKQETQSNANSNAVTHVTQSNASVTHSPIPSHPIIKNKDNGEVPSPTKIPEWPLREFPKVNKAYKTLWADIQREHPAVKYPSRETKEGQHKHHRGADVVCQVLRIDGMTESRFLEVWRWLFDSDDPQAAFWRKQCQSLEQLRKKKSGDTLNRFQKIAGEFDRAVKPTASAKPFYDWTKTPEYAKYTEFIKDHSNSEEARNQAWAQREKLRHKELS